MDISHERRRVVVWMGAALASMPLRSTPALGADRRPTPAVDEGPFYPRRFPADSDADLTRIAGRDKPAEGTPLTLTGRVVDRSGRPRAGARVEVWQCDSNGLYHHVGEPEARLDPNFQGFGALETDADGRYSFRTIKPVPYGQRTPHIHFTVSERGRRVLTSQLFMEGDAMNARDGLYRALGDEARLVTMPLESAGNEVRGAFDIVLG